MRLLDKLERVHVIRVQRHRSVCGGVVVREIPAARRRFSGLPPAHLR